MASCVSKKDYNLMEQSRNEYMRQLEGQKVLLDECELNKAALKRQIERMKKLDTVSNEKIVEYEKRIIGLNEQIEYLKKSNNNMLNQLESLSVISKQGAENIRKSLETLSDQSKYIKNLNNKIQSRDSLNLVLATTIKRSLNDVNDPDIEVQVEKGVVFISISDKMLFDSGKYNIKPRAGDVLAKIAKIAKDHNHLDLLVEGHTDNVPVKASSFMRDNWDLSALRAASVVRTLQKQYGVDPSRMTAAGRSEYVPKASNTTAAGRSKNRRTKIYLLPKLDQFFQLVEEGATNQTK